jgi:hypothetical protein
MSTFSEILATMHKPPKEYTGAWWRGECDPDCKACQMEHELKKDRDEMRG